MIKGANTSNYSNAGAPRPVAEVELGSGVVSLTKESMAPAVIEETKQNFSLTTVGDKYTTEIMASGEIDKLTSMIDISNTTSIIEFGRKPAEAMAKVADQVLSKYDMTTLNQTSQLVDNLLAVMKKIDINEIQDAKSLLVEGAKKSFFDRFKKSAQEKLDMLVGKYRTLGGDMEKICNELVVYEQQIKQSNKDIAKMYDASLANYRQLKAYILAGDQAVLEITEYRNSLQREFEATGNPELQFEIQNVSQTLNLMEQRVQDLRGAESVALMAVPTFKVQELTNANLARKINSAMITTVPAFKTALVNSVVAKQQSIQMQGLAALDEATSMLVRKNAENSVKQLQMSQQLANTSAVKADDIEYAWNTIMTGIQQYKEMEKAYKDIRKDEANRIEAANNAYLTALSTGEAI